ncbi:MAG: hypothetical protein ACRDQ4_12930 [Pseudonocardiaceae bacterium]
MTTGFHRYFTHRAFKTNMTARLIWIFEKLGWAHDVHWPTTRRLARLTVAR